MSRPSSLFIAFLLVVGATVVQAQDASVILRLRPGATVRAVSDRVAAVAGTERAAFRPAVRERSSALLSTSRLDRYVVVTGASRDVLDALASDVDVELIEPNARRRVHADVPDANDPQFQWALERIEAKGAWRYTYGSAQVRIGFIDTGIEFTHPDLAPSVWINGPEDRNGNGRFDPWPASETRTGVAGDLDGIDQDGNGFPDDVIGYDFVDQTVPNVGDWSGRDGVPSDENAGRHGTSVAGVMSAVRDNAIGVAGLAPASPLVALRAFDATGNGEDDDIAAAIVYAADNGVRVLNMSFGDAFNSTLLRDAVRYARARGVVLVASAGNEGVSEPHYPSSWPEVIAVAMTDSLDYRNEFSNYGSQISLAAPGVQVATTGRDSGYARVGGTSIAAPYVSAAAALMLARHPDWSPEQVRSTLELTTDDRGTPGWDEFYGAGRLNVRRALEYEAPAHVEISSPESGTSVSRKSTVAVVGTVTSPFLSSWQVFIGAGALPDSSAWRALVPPGGASRVHDVLAAFEPWELADTVYTIRLVATQRDGRVTERRVTITNDRTAPRVTSRDIRPVWRFDRRALAVVLRTDDLTRLEARVRRPGGTYRSIALEPERTGLLHTHYLLLTVTELEPDVAHDLYLVATNATGDTAMVGSPTAPLRVVRPGEAFPLRGFARKPYTLPFGVTDDEVAPIYGPGSQAVAINRAPAGAYGKLMVYNFESGAFVARDSVDAPWIPRGFGDIDNDGRHELLVQSGPSTAVFGQSAHGGSVVAQLRWLDSMSADSALRRGWGAGLHNVDEDEADELIGRTDVRLLEVNGVSVGPHYFVADWSGSDMVTAARMFNTTQPARGESRNEFGPPAVVVQDFDGDGVPDLLFGDDDADFMIFARRPGGRFEPLWRRENVGKGGSDFIAAGDFDADGRAEAVVGWRSELVLRNADGEYDPPFWDVQVLRIRPDGTDSVMWQDRIAYVRPVDPFRSGVSVGNLDGRPGDELILSTFPGLSVLAWDRATSRLAPLWWREGSLTNDPIVHDFDGDGREEVGVGNSRTIEFWQDERPATGPPVVAGLEAWARDDSSAFLRWSPVAGADRYVVYRGLVEPGSTRIRFEAILDTTATSVVDTGRGLPAGRLASGATYAYTVSAIDTVEGDIAEPVTVFTHPRLRLVGATALSSRELRLVLDGVSTEEMLRPGAVDVRDAAGREVGVSSLTTAGDQAVAVHLLGERSGDTLSVRLTSLFRDLWLTPADTTSVVRVAMPLIEEPGERFIAWRAGYVVENGVRWILVDFNASVDPVTTAVTSNYELAPTPTIGDVTPVEAAVVDPENPRRVRLRVSADYPIGALGRRYTVTVTGVRSVDGREINNGGSSVVGLIMEAPDLASVSVYPQPFAPSRDEHAMFAGLPRGARVDIFSTRGALLRTLKETEHTGGVEWDGRDDHGALLPTGVYLYRVSASDSAGEPVESELKKVVVVAVD